MIAALLHKKIFGKLFVPFPGTTKLRTRGFLRARKNSCKTSRYEVKCCHSVFMIAAASLALRSDNQNHDTYANFDDGGNGGGNGKDDGSRWQRLG